MSRIVASATAFMAHTTCASKQAVLCSCSCDIPLRVVTSSLSTALKANSMADNNMPLLKSSTMICMKSINFLDKPSPLFMKGHPVLRSKFLQIESHPLAPMQLPKKETGNSCPSATNGISFGQ